MTTTHAFVPGRSYWTRSIGDSDIVHSLTVASRTAKFITTTSGKRLGISVYEGAEQVKPNGSYSMCAIIGADKDVAVERARLEEALRLDIAAGNLQAVARHTSRLAVFNGQVAA